MGGAGIFVAVLAILLTGVPQSSPPKKPPDPMPDLATSIKCSTLVRPNQDITVTVTVENKGLAPAPESDFDILIKNGHAPREVAQTFKRKIRALEVGDHFSYSFKIRVALGLYEICGTADRKKKIPDTDRKNNIYCVMIEGK